MTVEGQAAVLAAVDSAGARVITVVSTAQGPVLPAAAVDRIASPLGVTWVVGLGPVRRCPQRPWRGTRAGCGRSGRCGRR